MLDTVHFYISNPVVDTVSGATRYHELIEHVTKKGIDKSTKFSYKEQFTPGVSLTVVNGTFYDDTGTVYFHNDNLKVKSSSSELVFCANYAKQRIEVNVSVPKWIAGNNVYYMLDFVDYHDFKNNASAVYKMIKFYVRAILDDLSDKHFHLYVESKHISIERIDLCYNVLCKDGAEKKRRIKANAQLNKRRQTKPGNECVYGEYGDESFTVKSSLGWYFKCYDKQLEFKKNDYKKIAAVDKDKAELILQQSENILRYELGIRSSFMDYLFWNNLFWKDSPDQDLWKQYVKFRHNPPGKNAEVKFIGKERVKVDLTNEEKLQNEKDYSTFKYLRSEFMPFTFKALNYHLGSHDNNPVWYKNELTPGYGFKWNTQLLDNEKSFDKFIVNECWAFFMQMLDSYNPDFKNVRKEVENYQSQSWRDKQVLEYLRKGKSFDEAIKKYDISRATVYNMKKRFEKQGIDINNKSIHQPQDFFRPVSLAPYWHFKAINNLFIVNANNIPAKLGKVKRKFS
jgi:hypothetical protein